MMLDSTVDILTMLLAVTQRNSRISQSQKFFNTPERPDQLWEATNFLYNS